MNPSASFSGLRGPASSAAPLRFARPATALLVAFWLCSLAGCTMLRIGYGQLDTLAAWKADEYLDLDSQQKHEFRSRFEIVHTWHRSEQLPEYAAFLTEAKSRLQKPPTRDDINWFIDGIRTRYRTLVIRLNPDAAFIFASLKPEQLVTLQQQWDRDNRAYIREHRLKADPEERKRARAERTLDQIREWTGSLTPEQERRITEMSDNMPPVNHLRLADRMRRQRELRQLLDARTNDEFAQRLSRWLVDWETGRAPEYQRTNSEWWRKRVDLFVATYELLTPQQRAAVARRLQNYIDDFTILAERAGARPARQ